MNITKSSESNNSLPKSHKNTNTHTAIDHDTFMTLLTNARSLPDVANVLKGNLIDITGNTHNLSHLAQTIQTIIQMIDNGEKINSEYIDEQFGGIPGLKDTVVKFTEHYAVDTVIEKRIEEATTIPDLIQLFTEAEDLKHDPFGTATPLSGLINSLRTLNNNVEEKKLPDIDDQIGIYDACKSIPGLNESIAKILENMKLIKNT